MLSSPCKQIYLLNSTPTHMFDTTREQLTVPETCDPGRTSQTTYADSVGNRNSGGPLEPDCRHSLGGQFACCSLSQALVTWATRVVDAMFAHTCGQEQIQVHEPRSFRAGKNCWEKTGRLNNPIYHYSRPCMPYNRRQQYLWVWPRVYKYSQSYPRWHYGPEDRSSIV